MRRNKGFTLIELMIVIAIIAIIAAIAIPGLLAAQRAANERAAAASMKSVATAQADFRANDRDGNKVQDFWTGDVAGLFCIKTVDSTGSANKLIELSLAAADSDPLAAVNQYNPAISSYANQGPKSGYWFWALASDLSIPEVYRGSTGGNPAIGVAHYHNSKFGVITYPDSYPSSGKAAFILNEGNSMYRRSLTTPVKPASTTPPGPVTAAGYADWPSDQQLKTYWAKSE